MTPVLVAAGLTVAAGALGVAAELCVRAWISRRGRWYVWTPYKRVLLELDRTALPDLPSEARLCFNAEGERGGPLPRDWSHTYRVLVAGGSAAECYFLDQDTAWPAVLERRLNEPRARAARGGEPAYVGNLARSLVSCEYITKILQKTLPRYQRLDAIVLMVGASDVVYWLEQGTPDHIEDDRLDPSYMFTQRPDGPFGWRPDTLALRRLLSLWKWKHGREVERRSGVGKRLIDLRAMRARAVIQDQVPDPAPLVAYFERHFRALLETCLRHAPRVVVARQPWLDRSFTPEEEKRLWNFGRGRPYVEEVELYYSHRVVAELMRTIDASAARLAAELGAEPLHLLPLVHKDFDHFYDYLHLTPAGAEVVGEAVAEHLLGGSPAPPAAPPPQARGRAAASRTGQAGPTP